MGEVEEGGVGDGGVRDWVEWGSMRCGEDGLRCAQGCGGGWF